jgi:hypothetical protein
VYTGGGDLDDFHVDRGRRQQHQRLGDLAAERLLAQATYQNCDFSRCHDHSFTVVYGGRAG